MTSIPGVKPSDCYVTESDFEDAFERLKRITDKIEDEELREDIIGLVRFLMIGKEYLHNNQRR